LADDPRRPMDAGSLRWIERAGHLHDRGCRIPL